MAPLAPLVPASLHLFEYVLVRGISILGEARNVEISGANQQLLYSKYHDFLAFFALAH